MQCLHIHPHYLGSSRLILSVKVWTWKNNPACRMHHKNSNKQALHWYELLGYCEVGVSHLESHTHHLSLCPRCWIPPASASSVGKRTSIPWHKKNTANVTWKQAQDGTEILHMFYLNFKKLILYCNHPNFIYIYIYIYVYIYVHTCDFRKVQRRHCWWLKSNHRLDLSNFPVGRLYPGH